MMRRRVRRVAVAVGVCGFLCGGIAVALSEDEALGSAQLAIVEVEAGALAVAKLKVPRVKTAEERLAMGEMLQRNKDHETAILVFNQILELFVQGKANQDTHADALFLLGESYFETGQLPSARRHFRTLASEGNLDAYAGYAGRALSRLVDIAMRRGFPDELDVVFRELGRLGTTEPTGVMRYALGKANFAAGRYSEAIAVLRQIPASSPMKFQASYLLGVVYMRQALSDSPPVVDPARLKEVPVVSQQFAQAILQFHSLTQQKPETDEQRHVVDLAWLALGRLFYETENPLDAVHAYDQVNKSSPEFPTMLFELAWVYVSLKDFVRAQDTLEVLEIVAPDTLGLAEGALLRADLMLRSKEFPEALRAYEGVRTRFGPAFEQLEEFLEETKDPAAYYDRLVDTRLGVRTRGDLPPVIMEWVREVEDERAFALIDDVTRSRNLIRESERMTKIMGGVLSAPTRARAFPDLRMQIQRTLGLLNHLSQAKRTLVLGLDAATDSLSVEAAKVRRDRQALMGRQSRLPVEVRDFLGREAATNREWDLMSQSLQQLGLQTDEMRATVNGVRRLLAESAEFGIALSPARRAQLTRELKESQADLDLYQRKINDHRETLERGRLQVGFGGSKYQADERLRGDFDALVQKEFGLALAGHSGEDAVSYAQRAMPLLERAAQTQVRLEQLGRGYDRDVGERAAELLTLVERERDQVKDDSLRLDVLDQQARHLFGELAMRSFRTVRDKLGSILLRADVGIAQEAWEQRQAHFDLVQNLQRLRATREQHLNEEFEEVLDDGGEAP